MTQCTSPEIRSKAPGRREIVARFDGGDITSDAGALLLGAVEDRRAILKRFAGCFTDHRAATRIEHTVEQLVAQRVLAIALGYEDVVDHKLLRTDPLLAALVGKAEPKGEPLAAPATIHRLELSHPELAEGDRYCRISLAPEAVDELLVDLFLEARDGPPLKSCSTSTRPTIGSTVGSRAASSTATTTATATCRSTSSPATTCSVPD